MVKIPHFNWNELVWSYKKKEKEKKNLKQGYCDITE